MLASSSLGFVVSGDVGAAAQSKVGNNLSKANQNIQRPTQVYPSKSCKSKYINPAVAFEMLWRARQKPQLNYRKLKKINYASIDFIE